jgi:hypothetical protein
MWLRVGIGGAVMNSPGAERVCCVACAYTLLGESSECLVFALGKVVGPVSLTALR